MHTQANSFVFLKLFITLIAGIIIGFTLSQLLNTTQYETVTITTSAKGKTLCKDTYKIEPQQSITADTQTEEDTKLFSGPFPNTSLETSRFDTEIADRLFKEVKVLCWVLTGPQNHDKKARHVKNTWGSRCNKLIFMSSKEDTSLGAVNLNVGEGRGNLWNKTRQAFKYIYDHHLYEYDWFLKADDDTYVIVENLRAFLYSMSPRVPVYFGSKFKPHVRQGYMSGGAGYVLSREAVRLFVERAYPNRTICRQTPGGAEDKEMGICLQNVGVIAGDSRDDRKRERFLPTHLYSHIIPKDKSNWYWRYIFYGIKNGPACCSDYIVSFHYVAADDMYVMDYLVYQLRPFGILQKSLKMPMKKNMNILLDKWLNEKSDNPL